MTESPQGGILEARVAIAPRDNRNHKSERNKLKMTHRKHGLGLLGGLLAVAALGTMLFAAGAQANSAQLLFFKHDNTKISVLHATAGANDDGVDGELLVQALNLAVQCTNFTVQQGLVLSATDADAKLLYENCTPLTLNLGAIPTCHIQEAASGKLHITATALLLPIKLADGSFGILAENIKALIQILGEECTLPEDNVVTGTVCAKGASTTPALEYLIKLSETIQLGCGLNDKLVYGAQTSYIDGNANIFLTGAHAGLKLTVD